MAGKYLDGSSLLAIRTYIAEAIASALTNVYEIKGSATIAQLSITAGSGNITAPSVGDVYNVSDSGTIKCQYKSTSSGYEVIAWDGTSPATSGYTTLSLSGIIAGDNVVWTSAGWDKLAGTIDLSGYLARDGSNSVTGDILPDQANTRSLGSTQNCYKNIFATAFVGTYLMSGDSIYNPSHYASYQYNQIQHADTTSGATTYTLSLPNKTGIEGP